MWKELLAYVLPLLAWGALSGVLNLILTRKSQIEAWVNANPRLAAWAKFLRGVGFDPWAVIAWFTLLVKKKLPEAQQANSPVAKLEQRKADAKKLHVDDDLPPPPPSRWVPPTMLLCLLLVVACSSAPKVEPRYPGDPCTPEAHAKAKRVYQADVALHCATYDVLDECPFYPKLKADFDRKIEEGCAP